MSKTEAIPKLFMSYKSNIEGFVAKVCHCLLRQAKIDYYFYKEKKRAGEFPKQLEEGLKSCDCFVFFVTNETMGSKWQLEEADRWLDLHNGNTERFVIVNMDDVLLQVHRNDLINVERVLVRDVQDGLHAAISCANQILNLLDIPAAPFDDLPISIEAKYEKDIIKLYKENQGTLPSDFIRKGYPLEWPKVSDYRNEGKHRLIENPLDPKLFGEYRIDDSAISVDARFTRPLSGESTQDKNLELTFPEAGPRRMIITPPNTQRIAILVSGGIAPGINAVISAIMDRHRTYETEFRRNRKNKLHRVEVLGCVEGFRALCDDGGTIISMDIDEVNAWVNRGGSVLSTARADQLLSDDPETRATLLKKMVNKLKEHQIDTLYVIGGDGSMRAAHAIWTTHTRDYPDLRLSVICIPKTMDNDILWVWQSFGFLSAVEEARQDIIQLSTEAKSNPRVGIMQLFGSSSGYVVSHAALGSNVCDLALIPELEFSMVDVCNYMRLRLSERRYPTTQRAMMNRNPYGLIVMAETAIPTDFEKYIDDDYVGLTDAEKIELKNFKIKGRHVLGQTPDALRSAGLKIVSRVLQKYIRVVMGKGDEVALGWDVSFQPQSEPDSYWESFRVFTNEPRHLIRSMEPTVSDVAYGIRLGTMAVDMALAGYTDCMVSQWLTEYVVVPLKLVVLGRKQVPKAGIFWRTVVSKTEQIQFNSLTE